jgi:hypothetical protein
MSSVTAPGDSAWQPLTALRELCHCLGIASGDSAQVCFMCEYRSQLGSPGPAILGS